MSFSGLLSGSHLSVLPEFVNAASANLQTMGSQLRAANALAATHTTAIVAPAADEISTAVTSLFGAHAQQFQSLSARAAAYHDNFVSLLDGGAARYLSAEAANARQTLGSAAAADLQTMSHNSNYGPLAVSTSMSAAGIYGSATLNGPLGPLASLSLSATPLLASDLNGVSGFMANGSGSLNTSFGPLVLWSAHGSGLVSPTGGFSVSLSQYSLSEGAEGISLHGNIGPAMPMITGGSITTGGWELTFEGNQFSITPEFLRPLGLF